MNISIPVLRRLQAVGLGICRLPPKKNNLALSKRYALFYFCNISIWSVIHSFIPLHLDKLGFLPYQIGILGIMVNASAIVVPPAVLALAHEKWSSRRLFIVTSSLLPIVFLPLIWLKLFGPFALVYLLFSLLYRAPLSLLEPQAIRDAEQHHLSYEQARSWGSFGYIACMLLIGYLLDRGDSSSVFVLAEVVLIGTFLTGFLVSDRLKRTPARVSTDPHEHRTLTSFGTPSFWLLIAIVVLVWGSHAVLNLYLSLYLKELGWSATMISTAWMVGVLGEALVFHLFNSLINRVPLKLLLASCIMMTTLRWLLYGSTTDAFLILLAQSLHAFSFGGMYISSIRLIYRLLPEDQRDRGQGFLFVAGPGIGMMLGTCVTTYVARHMTNYTEVAQLFLAAAGLACTSLMLLIWIREPTQNPLEDSPNLQNVPSKEERQASPILDSTK
jgi:MFS transporter, PPP family, 3-phenylpropionic acid transporter